MNLAHKIQFYPYTDEQEILLKKSCGVARFTYNWALSQWKESYNNGDNPTPNILKKQFNSIRRVQFPWTYEVSKCASEQAFVNLGKSFSNFFKKTSKYPKFKKNRQQATH